MRGSRPRPGARARRSSAAALEGESPFAPAPAPTDDDVKGWLDDFVEQAVRSIGLGDQSLIGLWEHQRALHPHGRVYIWSLDNDLRGYDTAKP